MNSKNWTLSMLAAGMLLVPGCSTNPPHEPLGLAVEEMRQMQTQNPDAADSHGPMRLDGDKAHKVISSYRGEAQSASGVAGNIEINIGN
ncbi:hypothetical protein GCM10009104_34320 [Marinobacterium maritimum]|uniref:Lipoprotein n=1 Tax=Marinobacterium maritimum TaxID=500162 RepID=A0ABP3TGZ0_9GAMM